MKEHLNSRSYQQHRPSGDDAGRLNGELPDSLRNEDPQIKYPVAASFP
jgi:hypothetical protein